MKKTWWPTLCVLALAAMTGCFEIKQVITLNPDGSGKIAFDDYVTCGPQKMMEQEGEKPDPQLVAKQALSGLVGRSRGIDAWAELKCEVAPDGRVHATGVAYFPDITKVVMGGGKTDVKWTMADQKGTLEFVMKKNGPDASASAPAPKTMTDQELADAISAARMGYQQTRPMMAAMLGTMKMDLTYMLPGKLDQVEGFTRTDSGGVQIVIEGKKLLEVMDKMMADDAQLAAAIKSGKDPVRSGPGDEAAIEALFGKGVKAFKADTDDLKPQFDYKAEMEKAKAAQAEMFKKLGVDPDARPGFGGPMMPPPPPPAAGE